MLGLRINSNNANKDGLEISPIWSCFSITKNAYICTQTE